MNGHLTVERQGKRFELPFPPPAIKPALPQQRSLRARIKQLLKLRDAVLVAHYYTDKSIQVLAEETGGIVADSLAMARFGRQHSARTLVVAGVRFMGETAKVLSPEKQVLMPNLDATCSLDIGCPAKAFTQFCDAHPKRTVVVYANTSVAVKARADWVVTSSNALAIIASLDAAGEKIIWAPDKHLGHYIQAQTHADMLIWDSTCVVHDEFKANALKHLKVNYPDAAVLAHPESPPAVVAMADVVGSTSKLIQAVTELEAGCFIVATDNGIFHKMRQLAPHKQLIEAPTGGHGATCQSCAHCPWMAMNGLVNLAAALENMNNEIKLEPGLAVKAAVALNRMLNYGHEHSLRS